MELTEAQKESVKQWAKDGCGLSEIQKKITAELGIAMTYMDVRLLVLDMGLKLKEKSRSAELDMASPARSEGADTKPKSRGPDLAGTEPKRSGGVSVSMDRVTAPGAVASGTVTFSDGVSASWQLDQFGRLALNAGRPGYSPSQQDVQAFQKELTNSLARMGY
jgi:hypothetical protein